MEDLVEMLNPDITPYRTICEVAEKHGISAFGEWGDTKQWTLCIGLFRGYTSIEQIANAVMLFSPAIKPDANGWARFIVAHTKDQRCWTLHFSDKKRTAQITRSEEGHAVDFFDFESLDLALAYVTRFLWPQGSGGTLH